MCFKVVCCTYRENLRSCLAINDSLIQMWNEQYLSNTSQTDIDKEKEQEEDDKNIIKVANDEPVKYITTTDNPAQIQTHATMVPKAAVDNIKIYKSM